MALLQGKPQDEDVRLAARITGRLTQGRSAEKIQVSVIEPGLPERIINIRPLSLPEIH